MVVLLNVTSPCQLQEPAPRSHSLDDHSAPSPPRGPAVPLRQPIREIHVEDWQAWIAAGLGIVTNDVLCVTGSELSADEWTARHATEGTNCLILLRVLSLNAEIYLI